MARRTRLNENHLLLVKKIILGMLIIFCSTHAYATELTPSSPLFGETQSNISWIGHKKTHANNADEVEAGQVDIGKIDIDSDGKMEILKTTWSEGVSDKILTINIFKDESKF